MVGILESVGSLAEVYVTGHLGWLLHRFIKKKINTPQGFLDVRLPSAGFKAFSVASSPDTTLHDLFPLSVAEVSPPAMPLTQETTMSSINVNHIASMVLKEALDVATQNKAAALAWLATENVTLEAYAEKAVTDIIDSNAALKILAPFIKPAIMAALPKLGVLEDHLFAALMAEAQLAVAKLAV